ncbi:FHA domain-containing protein [Actinophytocola sediminis]
MARVICSVCGHGNDAGAADCAICGNPLAAAPKPATTDTADPTCPTCGAAVPNPANLVCVDCLAPLAGTPRLRFPGREIDIPSPGSVLLGRDPEQSPVAEYFAAHDNVSRRHASVGVSTDGGVWVRDEYSANGTFVNDRQVPGGQTVPLTPGDQLRLASDLVARVEPGRPA